MGDVSRTITVKFTGNTKNLVASVAEANAALKAVGKTSPELEKLSKSLESTATNSDKVSKTTSKLTGFKNGIVSLTDNLSKVGNVVPNISLMTAAIGAAVLVAPHLLPLVGLLGLLPGAAAVAGAAFGVLKLGSDGIAAAFKGVGDAAKKQVSDVFQKELAPAAKAANALLKALTPSLKDVAWEMAHVGDATIETAGNANNLKSMNTVLASTKKVVGDIGGSLGLLVSSFLTIASIAAPIFAKLTSGAIEWSVKLQNKVQEIADNGKLAAWIQAGIAKFVVLKNGVVRAWDDIKPILEALGKQRFTLFAGIGTVIEPSLKAIGDFLTAHPDFAQWIVAGGLALKGFAAAMVLVNAAMDVNPIILAIEAIALLALGLAALYNNNAGFKQWVDATWKGIQAVTNAFVTWWQQNVAPILAKGWELVEAAAQGAYEYFRDTLVPQLKKLWGQLWPVLQQAWQNLVDAWNGIKPTLKEVYDWIKSHWSEIKQAAKEYGEAVGVVVGVVVFLLGALLTTVVWAFGDITAQIKLAVEIFNWLNDTVKNVNAWIRQRLIDIGNAAADLGRTIQKALSDPWGTIQAAASGVLNWIQGQWNGLIGFFGNVGRGIANSFTSAFNGVVAGIRSAINQVIDLANSGIGHVNGVTGAVGIPAIPLIPHLAMGGPVQAGRPYIVGDGGGPELFVPRQSGRVVGTKDTADLMGGGGQDMSGDVVFQIDGEVFARIAKSEIYKSNRATKARVLAGARG